LETKSINSLQSEGQKNQNEGKINFKSRWFRWTLVCVGVLVVLILVSLYSRPTIAKRFIDRGDNLLNQSKYIEALVQYKKADYLINSEEIDASIDLTNEAQKDITKLEMTWREENNIEAQEGLKKAKTVYDSEYDSVVLARTLIENNQPQFAIVATKTAIEMEQNYADAWLYLGIAHIECANNLELSEENYNYHRDEANKALTQAQALSPENEDIKKYLEGM